MEAFDEENQSTIPFQLQFDKPLAAQVKIAEWNPEKDLLALVTEDSKILLHRFNWQRLWTISPGRCITSLCWRPDGKAIVVGLEDGTILLHDVENGKLLRSIRSHDSAVVCLNWEEDGQRMGDERGGILSYEDRTLRFFPSAPRVPRMLGVVQGEIGITDGSDDSVQGLSNSSHQHFNILCSGDRGGSICFSIFGIFPIGKINIQESSFRAPLLDERITYQLSNASIYKVALSKDLNHLIVMSFGGLVEEGIEQKEIEVSRRDSLVGLHCLLLDTSVFRKRKKELHQVAQQASNIEDLFEIVRASLSIMRKQWNDAMQSFHEKFNSLSPLIADHGLDSSPQEEFLSLLGGARTSPPIHQFLVNSLGEPGLKRISKAVDNAGKELHLIVREHLQPAIEIIGFRIGELRGMSRWRARYQAIGLDEKLINNATEEAGMLLVQVERFLRVLAIVEYQFQNFFCWLSKCVKLLMPESSDPPPSYNSELVITFLKFLFDQDPVKHLLDVSEDNVVEIDLETRQRIEELVQFGGFSDSDFLSQTLAKEFEQIEYRFKEALEVPFTTISKKIYCKDIMPLFPIQFSSRSTTSYLPASVSYYEDTLDGSSCQASDRRLLDYICFRMPENSLSDLNNYLVITRGLAHDPSVSQGGHACTEALLLRVPSGYECVDLSLYKDSHIVLVLNETTAASENPGGARMMILQTNQLPFVSVIRSAYSTHWKLLELKDFAVELNFENEKVRHIPHSVQAPLAVSASRGLACVFAMRKRALVYILEEDEDEVSEAE
ncbi:hypothetical protein Sjap_010647 [Stephania japonica]|uniref:Anaphase-promoting complex subunit 4 n=1 Tax=Stephania japonica TaxID=461633 RepID=A0AAP0JAV1_9MAGN